MKKVGVILSLVGVFVVFLLYLKFPEIETFFALYANGAMWFVLGILKGHNYGVCRKCGKDHGVHPRKGCILTEETKLKIAEGNRGRVFSVEHCKRLSEAMKDRKFSPEHLAKIVAYNKSPEKRRQVSEFFKDRPSPLKGRKLSFLHRLRIALAWRTSPNNHDGIKKFHEERNKARVREFYDLPEGVEFFPVTLYEHKFARKVLIGGGYAVGFYCQHALPGHPEWFRNNENETKIPVTI